MPGHGGNRTYDLWNTSPMLCQLSYAVRTVRVSDISEQNLVPSIPVQSSNMIFFLCWCCVLSQVNMMIQMMIHHIHLSTQHQHRKKIILLDCIGIEGTRFCSEISLTRTVLTARTGAYILILTRGV